jgi:hypothetical protein
MSYDRSTAGNGPQTMGWGGGPIDLSTADFQVPDTVKGVTLTSPGNVALRAVRGTVDIIMTNLPSGYVLPWHCSHIRKTGTTAALATIIG